MFTSIDYDKFRALRVTHVATHFEQLLADEANDDLTPEQLFLTAVDDALEQRRANRVDKLIRSARVPHPARHRRRDRTSRTDAASPPCG
ncbi:MAG: hypothetical protein V9G10_12755 [Candidatus Nanopelagicales bacterium]